MARARVLILGGGFSYIGCIQAAAEMGCEVLVADRNDLSPGLQYAHIPLHLDITDIQGCLEAAETHHIDGVVAVNDFGVMTASIIADELGLPGLPVDIAEIVTDKYLMREAWRKSGLSCIEYIKTHSYEEFLAAVHSLSFPLIVKPCDSRGGGCRGICTIDGSSDLEQAYRFANGFYGDDHLIVERFVEGLEHSVEAIVHDAHTHIIAVSDKQKCPLPYRVDETVIYPTVESGKRLEWLHEAVEKAVSAIGMREGIVHVELSITDAGPVLFEIGARCGGGAPAPLVPFLCGVEEFKEAVRIALGERPRDLAPRFMRGCAIRFLCPRPGKVTRITGAETASALPGVLSFGLFIKEGDHVQPLHTCADRAGMVITGGRTRDEALDRAEHVVNSIRIETA